MAIKAKDIVFEVGEAWVASEREVYTVFVNVGTHSVSDSSYQKDEDGLSIAKARAAYLARRKKKL